MTHLTTKGGTIKEKEIAKTKIDKINFDLESFIFSSKLKLAATHLRQFKRFCKVFCTNLVDLFPAKKHLASTLVREILNLAHCKMRLLRLGFTHIGLHLFNHLLSEVGQLNTLKGFFSSKQ